MIRINGNDLVLLGLSIGIAGTLILAKGYVFKSPRAIMDESASYFGANPFAVKNKVVQKWEGVGGIILLLPATILQLLGVFFNLTGQKAEPVFTTPLSNLIFLLLLSVVLMWGTNIVSGFVARNKAFPELKKMLAEAMEQTETVLNSDGLYAKEVGKNIEVNRETRDTRLRSIRERLDTWERLFAFQRRKDEKDHGYLQRLKTYLETY